MNETTLERLIGGVVEIFAILYLLIYGVVTGIRDLIKPAN